VGRGVRRVALAGVLLACAASGSARVVAVHVAFAFGRMPRRPFDALGACGHTRRRDRFGRRSGGAPIRARRGGQRPIPGARAQVRESLGGAFERPEALGRVGASAKLLPETIAKHTDAADPVLRALVRRVLRQIPVK